MKQIKDPEGQTNDTRAVQVKRVRVVDFSEEPPSYEEEVTQFIEEISPAVQLNTQVLLTYLVGYLFQALLKNKIPSVHGCMCASERQ